MKISDERSATLYRAISEPIMQMRIQYSKAHPLPAEELDAELFKLERRIWREVVKALNLERT